MFLPTTTKKPFDYLFSKEAREVKRLKDGIASNKARITELTNKMRAMKAATKGAK